MNIVTIGKISKATVNSLMQEVDMLALECEEEQTIITDKFVYDINYCMEDDEVTIKKYTYGQYANKFGEGTLEDLRERL